MARKFTKEQLMDIWREGGFEIGTDWVDVEVLDDGHDSWEDGGKYQDTQVVFIYEGKTYAFNITRSGSYFSHYEYEIWDDAYEVELATKTITYWRAL